MERYGGVGMGLRVSEGGHGELRTEVDTEAPHLVSMGSGRLSTGVTLHPLPANKGRVAVGSGMHCDIPVQGTGVEDTHCFIENSGNIVTLHPMADMTYIDGMKVSGPTRLAQGSMLCIGRSNYLRFNHPAEAKLMKSMLPYTRISMAPLNFSAADRESLDAFQQAIRAVDSLEKKSSTFRSHPLPTENHSDGSDSLTSSLQSCVLGKISKFESLAQSNNQNRYKTPPPAVFSPKVFPPGSATVNTPACDVLGPDRAARRLAAVPTPSAPGPASHSSQNKFSYSDHRVTAQSQSSRSQTSQDLMSKSVVGLPGNPLGNGNTMYYEDVPSSGRQNYSSSPNSNTFYHKDIMSSSMVVGNHQDLENFSYFPSEYQSGPSSYPPAMPSFNGHQYKDTSAYGGHQFQDSTQNGLGLYQNSISGHSGSPLHKCSGSSQSNKPVSSGGQGGRKTPVSLADNLLTSTLRQKYGSPSTSLSGSTCSLEELAVRGNEMDLKRKLAVVERMMEQEVERAERARLDEILSMCADYERQAQKERTPKHQQKSSGIKTNGSLPRDKRNAGSSSPGPSPQKISSSTDDIHQIFTFDTSTSLHSSQSQSHQRGAVHHNYENVVPRQANGCKYFTVGGSEQIQALGSYDNGTSSPVPDGVYPYENPLPSSPAHPGSPRTRIKTVAMAKEPMPLSLPRDITQEVLESQAGRLNSRSRNTSFSSPEPQAGRMCTSTPTDSIKIRETLEFQGSPLLQNKASGNSVFHAQNEWHCVPKPTGSQNIDKSKFILPLENHVSSQNFKQSSESSLSKISLQQNDSRPEKDEKEKDCERDSGIPASPTQEVSEKQNPANGKIHNIEIEVLQKEKSKILSAMTVLKGKVTDIEQQEAELEREMEMERALIEAELQAQTDKLRIEEGRLISLRDRVAQLDADMAECQAREVARQAACREHLEIAERKAEILQVELAQLGQGQDLSLSDEHRRADLEERLRLQQDAVDTERKLFEDLEFRQLEEEAGWLAGREELQRELTEAAARVAARVVRVDQLRAQNRPVGSASSDSRESLSLEEQRLAYLKRLEQGQQRLNELDTRLEELGVRTLSSNDVSSETDEDKPGLVRQASQDDLDRISRVTSGAPLDLSDTGSLGRKTLESLKEIERNRQLHLVQQGSMVIEQERRRVQQLKRRVQDEVRAQWEEKKREMNCSSLVSVASEDGSLTSSDLLTESASGDDTRGSENSHAKIFVDGVQNIENTSRTDLNLSYLSDCQPNGEPQAVAEQQAQRDRLLEESRPLSDASSYDDHLSPPVRARDRDRERNSRLQQRPLTRYLPFRGESLDLRQHIETAGHQIELCPHVTLDEVSCRGVLHKMASKFHSWQKRWFVFDRSQRTLAYYSNRNEGKPRGGVYFQYIEEVYVDHLNSVKSPQPQLTFVVKTRERTYHLMAPSPEALRIWVDVIFTGAEGYQEFEHGS